MLIIASYDLLAFTKVINITQDAVILKYYPTSNYGSDTRIVSDCWTASGTTTITRSLFNIDLDQIPANAVISSARLSLYAHQPQPNDNNRHMSYAIKQTSSYKSNASYLKRVTSTWDQSTVTWNNQPTTITTHQVTLSESTSYTQDYLNIDVTALVADMMSNRQTSFGLMLQLVTEAYYSRMCFASSNNVNSALRPKIEITYTLPATFTELISGDADVCGYYSCHESCRENQNGSADRIEIGNLELALSYAPMRSFLYLDMNEYEIMEITEAKLYLYGIGHDYNGGNNALRVEDVGVASEECDENENTITWLNQPENFWKTILTQSTTNQDYVIDITELFNLGPIKVVGPTTYMFRLRFADESSLNSGNLLRFASSENTNVAKRPKIVFKWVPTGSKSTSDDSIIQNNESYNSNLTVDVFPNPSTGLIDIRLEGENEESVALDIISSKGASVRHQSLMGTSEIQHVDLSNLPKGLYFMCFNAKNGHAIKQLVLQ
jgi:hypothetical protein